MKIFCIVPDFAEDRKDLEISKSSIFKKKKKGTKILDQTILNRRPLAQETLDYPSELSTTRRPEVEKEYYSTDVRSRIVVAGDQPVQFLSFLAEKKPLRRRLRRYFWEYAKHNSTLVLSFYGE